MNDSPALRSPLLWAAAAIAGLLVLFASQRYVTLTAQNTAGTERLALGAACTLQDTAGQNQEIFFISCGGIF